MIYKKPLYTLIETRQDLERFAVELSRETAFAVDLEADSMFHYREKVCLLQFSGKCGDFLLDTLAIQDLSVLTPIFADGLIRKVFHGADYDVRSLKRDFGITVNGLFDTQIAAMFLGFRQIDLAGLLKKTFGVVLEKKFQKKNWSVRPLPREMLDYAVRDVDLLIPLTEILEKNLVEKGRLSWAEEECAALSTAEPSPPRDEPLFIRFRGAGTMKPRGLSILEAILQYRNNMAKRRDVPAFKVLRNEVITEAVEDMEADPSERNLRSVAENISRQSRIPVQEIAAAVREAMALPENSLPAYPRIRVRNHFTPGMIALTTKLREWRTGKSAQLDIDPSIICTNALIGSVVRLGRKPERSDLDRVPELREWRKREFGDEILSIIRVRN